MNNLDKLLLDLWWLEYVDVKKDANKALDEGNKLKALALAIDAHKIKQKYYSIMDKSRFDNRFDK